MPANSVLVVDDERETVLEPLVNAFAQGGISIDTATTWDEAVEQFILGGHSLVIADWNLPGSKNGLLLLARLKQLRPGTRLVLFSGFLDDAQRSLVESLPFVDVALAKGRIGLTERLFVEAEAAGLRSQQRTDWAQLADGYRAAVDTNFEQVEELEVLLRGGGS